MTQGGRKVILLSDDVAGVNAQQVGRPRRACGAARRLETLVLRAQGAQGEGREAAEGNFGRIVIDLAFPLGDCYAYHKPKCLRRPA